MSRLIDFTDEELAAALHDIEGHEDCLEPAELDGWRQVLALVLERARAHREVEAENSSG